MLSLLLAETTAAAAAAPTLNVPPFFWVAFCAGTAVLLALDMFVFHRKAHEPSLRESALWTVFWCSLALVFNGWVWYWAGHKHAVEFFTGYLVEWSLSMDNVFVFVVIFAYFGVPLKYQYRVLFWGILGAIGMRLTFILAANQLIHINFVLELFGVFLIYTGIKLARAHGVEAHPDQNPILRFARRYLRVAKGSHGDKFFVRQDGKLFVTSLFMVLLVIESTDVVFAVDSVPAIFGITREPFIVFTSNVFAIMGLRALYFLLAGVMGLFRYLHYGLSAILIFIGIKMVVHRVWEPEHWQSLLVIVSLLAVSIIVSLIAARRERRMILEGRIPPPPGAGK
ncbi:MAG TPA: TerC family protein [Lacipirellulaceae bacterium]|nr:TerC family protein [Lacipirellulaceae bacterium]